jgi:hypothetical protein
MQSAEDSETRYAAVLVLAEASDIEGKSQRQSLWIAVVCHVIPCNFSSISLTLERDSRVQGLRRERAFVVTSSCAMENKIEGGKPRSLSVQ